MKKLTFGLITMAVIALSACAPQNHHQPVSVTISFLTQVPSLPSLKSKNDNFYSSDEKQAEKIETWLSKQIQNAEKVADNNNADFIAFYSDQDIKKTKLAPNFSYITALVLTPESIKKYGNTLAKTKPILASNIDFGLSQSGNNIYAYNPNKTRADTYTQSFNGEDIAYLSLINQSKIVGAEPDSKDLAIIRHTVDRLQINGINKIILISQFSETVTRQLTSTIRGLDVIVAHGEKNNANIDKSTCIATFTSVSPLFQTLDVTFSADGKITQCTF
ncbi:hypothetical protein L4D21_07100 [Photobacterium profundum]